MADSALQELFLCHLMKKLMLHLLLCNNQGEVSLPARFLLEMTVIICHIN